MSSDLVTNGNGVHVEEKPAVPKGFHTELKEYSKRRGTEYPYNDDLDIDVLIVGAGFGPSFLLYAIRFFPASYSIR